MRRVNCIAVCWTNAAARFGRALFVFPWTIAILAVSVLAGLPTLKSAAAQNAAKSDFGEPAPQWLREAEAYAAWFPPEGWEALAQSKAPFVTHCPVNREFFARCHALGIHCLPYVTFYHGDATQNDSANNIKAAPEWIEVDADGNYRRSIFWECEDNKNKYNVCPNVAGAQDAMLARVQQMLELGADGVFLDVVRAREPCYGPKFGKHKHLYDDQNHAFAMFLKRLRELIKRHRPDGALVANSGEPLNMPAEYWRYIDADMLESYICTWAAKDRWLDWKTHWHEQGLKLQPLLDAGKQIQAISFLGHTPYGVKEDAFFCYATARLAGLVWSCGVSYHHPEAAMLFRLRLGKPLHKEVEEGGVYWRAFENGLVAVNPEQDKGGVIAVKPPIPATRFCDLFSGEAGRSAAQIIDVAQTGTLSVPARSGRVFLYAPPTTNHLEKRGPRLTIATQPGLGEVRFRVDGFDYYTHAGCWKNAEYKLEANFGTLSIVLDKPGKHVIEVIDVIPADMKTLAGYNTEKRLGEAMDPSNPTKPSEGRKFRFRGWTGAVTSDQPRIELEITGNVQLTATYTLP